MTSAQLQEWKVKEVDEKIWFLIITMRSGGWTPHYGSSADTARVLDLTFGFATYVVAMVIGRCYYRTTLLMRCLISFVTFENVSQINRLCTLKECIKTFGSTKLQRSRFPCDILVKVLKWSTDGKRQKGADEVTYSDEQWLPELYAAGGGFSAAVLSYCFDEMPISKSTDESVKYIAVSYSADWSMIWMTSWKRNICWFQTKHQDLGFIWVSDWWLDES